MKSLLYLFTVCFWWQSVVAQTNFQTKADSLEAKLLQTHAPLIKSKILGELANLWQSKNLAKSLVYTKESVEYAKKSTNQEVYIGKMYTLAFAYMSMGDAPQSIKILQQLLPLTKNKDSEAYGLALAFISLNYVKQGDYSNALNYAYKSEVNYQKIIKTKGSFKDKRTYYGRLQNMAEIFEKMNRLDSAYYYGKQAYIAVQKPLPAEAEFFGWMNRLIYGKVLLRLHKNNEALKILKEARFAAKNIESDVGVQAVELIMSSLFREQNQVDSALVYATRVFGQAQNSANYPTASEAGFLLRSIYQTQNNATKALYYFEKATAAKDSITSSEKTRQVQILTFEAERKEQEIKVQQIAFENQIKQFALLASLIIFLIIGLIIYRNYRQQKQLNTQIEALNETLEQKVEQRTAELQKALDEVQMAFNNGQFTERKRVSADLHDEIGAALSTIAIFSDVTKLKAQKTAPELVVELEKIGTKSREMVQNMRDTIWTLNEDSKQNLWERMYQFSLEIITPKNIVLDWNLSIISDNIPFLIKRNLFLAYKEAIHNIVKHADASKVGVQTHQKDEKLWLTIIDNGKGFNLEIAHAEGNGLRNFQKRMTEIGGTVQIESKIGEGTKLTFIVPWQRA